MADFLPIGLSRDDGGVVSGLKEITTSDTIPENYLTISNTDPKWNSSALQGFAICDTSPTTAGTNPALVWNGSTWCASVITAAAVGGGGNGNATAINGYPIDATAVPNEGEVLRWDGSVWSYQPTATFRDYDATSIYGFPIDSGDEGPGKVLVFDGTNWNYEPTSVYVTPTPPNYNATAIDGYSVTSTNRDAGKVLVFDGTNWNYEPTSVYVAGGGGGVTGIGVPGEITRWLTTTSIETAGFSITPPTTDGRILKWNNSTTAIEDLGYTASDAQWNANYIQGVSALIPTEANNNYVLTYDYGENKLTWTRKLSQIGPTPLNSLGVPQTGDGQTGLTFGFTIPGASGTSATLYTFPTSGQYATSSFGTGTFFVTSGNTIVPAFLPDSLLRFYGAINGSFPTKAPPAELLKTGGELLYYDVTNERYTNTGDVKTVGGHSLTALNVSGTATVQGATVSATTYLNLPSSTIVWASANYATLAGSATSALIATNATSATSALNAQQAPAGFNVTGTILATTVSATNISGTTITATTYNGLPASFDATSIVGLTVNPALGAGNDGDLFYWDGLSNEFSTIGSGILLSGASVASATLAGSATSALNAQQALAGFNVTGTILATAVSATTLSATTISTSKYPTYIYTATGISVATNKLMFDMFNGTGSGKTLKLTRIVAYVRNTGNITGINQVLECYRTSSVGTAGTAITAGKMVTTDPDLNANITARNTPTGGAAYYIPSGILAAANIYTEEGQNLQERVYLYMYDSFAGLEECLTLQESEGIRINTGAVGAAGVIAIYVYFITV